MDKSFIHVPVLRTADGLPAWRRAVRLLCLSHDVWGNVTGDNVRPDDPALVRLFLKDDRKAQAILQSTLDSLKFNTNSSGCRKCLGNNGSH